MDMQDLKLASFFTLRIVSAMSIFLDSLRLQFQQEASNHRNHSYYEEMLIKTLARNLIY